MFKAYVGLDQALVNTGVSFVTEEDNYKTIRYFTIKTSTKQTKNERYSEIIKPLEDLMSRYNVQAFFMETTYSCGNKSTADLIKLEALLQFHFYKLNKTYFSLDSRSNVSLGWPKLVGSKGTKGKFLELIIRYLKDPINEHEVDSIGILSAGLTYLKVKEPVFSNYVYINVNKENEKPVRTRTTDSKTRRKRSDTATATPRADRGKKGVKK